MNAFHLIGLPAGPERQAIDRTVEALDQVRSGETVFLSESAASKPASSAAAFVRLSKIAQQRRINIFTSLNLGGDLAEDLPGHDPALHYNALCIFTRFGMVHVPQAKVAPQAGEMAQSPRNATVAPYDRVNLIRLDLDDHIVTARFLLSSDLMVFDRFSPRELACHLLVVLANFGALEAATAIRLVGYALKRGVATTALVVSGFDPRESEKNAPTEVVIDAHVEASTAGWNRRSIRNRFFIHDDRKPLDANATGHLIVPQSRWRAPIALGQYPVTVVLG